MSEPRAPRLRRTIALLLVVGYAVVIYGSSSRQAPESITDLEIPDFILHMVEYGGLGFLLSRWLRLQTGRTGFRWIVLLPAALATLYGIADEIHQAFVPGRDGRALDALADVLGSLLGATAYFLFARLRRPASLES